MGRFIDVTITAALAHSLRGRLADPAADQQAPRLAVAGG
jgi:hypothetical protein